MGAEDKIKYVQLKEKLNIIKNQLDSLDSIYNDLCGTLKKGLIINDDFVDSNAINHLKKNTDEIIYEIDNQLIFMINNKI
jgi:hypothetical protein